MMFFQDPSLLEFQRRIQDRKQFSNLSNVFQVQSVPKDSQMRDNLDQLPTKQLDPIFSDWLGRLQRGKHLESYTFLDRYYLVPIDGSQYFSSKSIHCSGCLRANSKNGARYYHQILLIPKNKITYRNSWVTDIPVDEHNVVDLVKGGRSRWKIENETFNTLKNQGYHIEHNYGHGSRYLSMNFFVLNLLAFYMHQIFELTDRLYQRCRLKTSSRKAYFSLLRYTFQILLFRDWRHFLNFIHAPPDIYAP